MILLAKNNEVGQTVLEYTFLLTALALVFLTMTQYCARAVRAKLLIVENQVNEAVTNSSIPY